MIPNDRVSQRILARMAGVGDEPLDPLSPVRCSQLGGRTGAKKDTLRNAEEVGQLVIAVVTEAMAARVNACAAVLEHGESEFVHSGLTPVPALKVQPPLVAESPVNMECEVVEIHSYGDQGGAGSLIVARLELMHVAESVRDEQGRILPQKLDAVGRLGGDLWTRTGDTFALKRP